MKIKNFPKGFRDIRKSIPTLGRNVVIFTRTGSSFRVTRKESTFFEEGYCYEDINMLDHNPKDVIAWKG